MKIKLVSVALALFLMSCGQSAQKNSTSTAKSTPTEQTAEASNNASEQVKPLSLDELMTDAEKYVGKEVTLRGTIAHTCKHSGKRAFVTNSEGTNSIRVEAGGKISGFGQDLIGTQQLITGTVCEKRLTKEFVAKYEEAMAKRQIKEDGTASTCSAEMGNVNKMKTWMKEHNKEYYAIYFIQGELCEAAPNETANK